MFIVAVVWLVFFRKRPDQRLLLVERPAIERKVGGGILGIPSGSWSGGLFLKWALPAFFYVFAMALHSEKAPVEVVESGQ